MTKVKIKGFDGLIQVQETALEVTSLMEDKKKTISLTINLETDRTETFNKSYLISWYDNKTPQNGSNKKTKK